MPRAQPQNDTRIAFYVPQALHDRVREAAAANGRSIAGFGRWLLIQAVEAHDAAELERRGGGWLEQPPRNSNAAAGDGGAAKATTAAAGVNDDRSTGRRDGR